MLLVKKIVERSPTATRIPKTKFSDNIIVDSPAFKIIPRSLARRGSNIPDEIDRCHLVYTIYLLAGAVVRSFLLSHRLFGDNNPCFLCQMPCRLRESHVAHLHKEGENMTALPATETIIHLFLAVHRKGRCFFTVKWTDAQKISSCLFKSHIFRNEFDDIRPLFYFLNFIVGNKSVQLCFLGQLCGVKSRKERRNGTRVCQFKICSPEYLSIK